MKITRIGICLVLLFCCLIGGIGPVSAEQYKIALIHSYEKGYVDADRVFSILDDELKINGLDCNIQEYFLDCEGYQEEEENEHISAYIDELIGWGVDLIAVLDDQATYALMACNNPKVRQIPVVFSGVNYPNEGLLEQYPNVTGYADLPDYLQTVRMIERMMGKSRICLLNGFTFLDQKIWKDLNEQCVGEDFEIIQTDTVLMKHVEKHRDHEGQFIALSHEQRFQRKELEQTAIVKITTDSIALRKVMWVGFEANSLFLFTKRDYTTLNIAALFKNPCFEIVNEGFGTLSYMLGGYFVPLETQLKDMAVGIRERLQGKMPDQQIRYSAKQYVVNWNVLQKYRIPVDCVPEEYTLMYIPFTERYYVYLLCGSILLGTIIVSLIVFLVHSLLLERKRKRKALHSMEYEHATLRFAIEGGSTYVWRLDGEVFSYDSQFYDLIHYPHNQISLADLLTYVHPEDRYRFRKNFLQTQEHPHYKGQYRCNFGGGEYQWWEFRYKTIYIAGQAPIVTGLLQNIQEVKDREEELIQARKLAERAELKQSFLNNMSHEIRTPLNAIVGFSNLLTSDTELSGEEKREFTNIINTNTGLLLKLVNDVLELSRIESNSLSFHFQEESLRNMLESFYQTYGLQIHPPVEFIKEFPEEDVTLCVDSMRLQQLITNLLNNANKFTTSGYIKLGYCCPDNEKCVRIYVEDTGKGIPAYEIDMIFERFYKRDEFAQGVGLGLAICRSIVERMNGRIEVESEEGIGSCFTVVLPLKVSNE